jgi:hypothetical protein
MAMIFVSSVPTFVVLAGRVGSQLNVIVPARSNV